MCCEGWPGWWITVFLQYGNLIAGNIALNILCGESFQVTALHQQCSGPCSGNESHLVRLGLAHLPNPPKFLSCCYTGLPG